MLRCSWLLFSEGGLLTTVLFSSLVDSFSSLATRSTGIYGKNKKDIIRELDTKEGAVC
jgi:hypothetical protein